MADPRPIRTRRLLLDAGGQLIAERGVAGLKLADITGRAGVALGSFQNHFASKDELVEAVIVEAVQTLAAQIVEGPAADDNDPAAAPIVALRRFVRLAYEDPAFCRLLVNLSRSEEIFVFAIRPYAHAALERAVSAGALHIADVDLAVTFTVAGALAVIRRILDGHLDSDADVTLAYAVLLSFGVDPDEAERLSSAPLR
ncbi:MAG TPA: TetR/AcrR family transcriptional regulator [Mycobacteriales bacterium]|jgi:AcrR family transcriptional regulator|nr:TetR/AcrR family transcriptional regulator [Mycobacteriales bacterium]